MKTVGKRINPAFTVVQPLPAWPVWPARQLDQTAGDRRAVAHLGHWRGCKRSQEHSSSRDRQLKLRP